MKPTVFVTRQVPQPGLDLLAQHATLRVNPQDQVLSRDELAEGIKDCQALLCLLTDKVDAGLMDLAPGLKIIANYAVGYDNVEVAAATARKIPVTNTPGVLTEGTADLTWAMILGLARRLVEGDRMTRAGDFKGWAPMLLLGGEVYGKTLGLLGLGRIGQAVARRASGFGMKVLYHTRSHRAEGHDPRWSRVDLETLLKESDFLSLHCPLTPQTRHLIGKKELGMMKPTTYLINTARGPVVDEAVLVEVLKAKAIAGAALDVYEQEPSLSPGLESLENALLLPHLGSATTETRVKMSLMAAQGIVDRLEGKIPAHVVNPEALK
jgi:glyoxylate reductase